jgi:hypothetical protein
MIPLCQDEIRGAMISVAPWDPCFWGSQGQYFSDKPKNFSRQQYIKTLPPPPPPPPPPVDNFFGEKFFPDNNITIAFVAFFPILVAVFPILQH